MANIFPQTRIEILNITEVVIGEKPDKKSDSTPFNISIFNPKISAIWPSLISCKIATFGKIVKK